MTQLLAAITLASCLLGTSVALGDDVVAVPPLAGRIVDTAHVLSATDVVSLTKLLADYEHETHHQIAVLTIPTLGGEKIEAFSLRVAEVWRLGYAGWDNGILVTLAMQEHRIRIELGTGMERYISDPIAKSIIVETMTPAFHTGDFAGGLRAGLMRLMDEARKYRIRDPSLRGAPTQTLRLRDWTPALAMVDGHRGFDRCSGESSYPQM